MGEEEWEQKRGMGAEKNKRKRIEISILLPTRGRPNPFRSSVLSLFKHAATPDSLELIIHTDMDDESMRDFPFDSVLAGWSHIIRTCGPRRGYMRLFEHFNEMAASSHGRIVLLWNDDITMLTEEWDVSLRQASPFAIQFLRRDILEIADTTLPALGRASYRIMGAMSLHPGVDIWIAEIAKLSNTGLIRNDIVFHHERINDQTMAGTHFSAKGFAEMVSIRETIAERIRAEISS